MSNVIKIDPERTLGHIDRNLFGGFAEHLGRCVYGGIYDPDSAHADEAGLRKDVLEALGRLNMPVMRYPGGNFVSGYRWRDGVGPKEERPPRMELAWHTMESNAFGTNEFIDFCRKLGSEPYMAVNCGDGDMREARDWLEYCNGTQNTDLVNLRKQHGYDAPHTIKYWGIGNEVDGPWQIGFKTPEEYARAYTEYAKVMKWTDPDIKLLASAVSLWQPDWVERVQLLLEEAGHLTDYLAIHWYIDNKRDDFAAFMAQSELIDARLTALEGMIHALSLARGLTNSIALAVDEYNVWYREGNDADLDELYNLEDALVIALHHNAFIRHARMVKMANLAQIVNVLAPVLTRGEERLLQTIYYPFELYSRTCGDTALDVYWSCDTFEGGGYAGVRVLDVAATLDTKTKKVAVYVVNRSKEKELDVSIRLTDARFAGPVEIFVVNGSDTKVQNTFDAPDRVTTRRTSAQASGATLTRTFEPHSVTALVFELN